MSPPQPRVRFGCSSRLWRWQNYRKFTELAPGRWEDSVPGEGQLWSLQNDAPIKTGWKIYEVRFFDNEQCEARGGTGGNCATS